MSRSIRARTAPAFLVAAALASCADEAALVPCAAHADCGGGEVCHEGWCRVVCNTSAQCASEQACLNGVCLPVAPRYQDAGRGDVLLPDRTSLDLMSPDIPGGDASPLDNRSFDAVVPDSGVPDTGVPDTGAPDTGAPDNGIPDNVVPDSGVPDVGAADTAVPDTAPILHVITEADCSTWSGVYTRTQCRSDSLALSDDDGDQDLPNNGSSSWIDMRDNVLLLHLDESSAAAINDSSGLGHAVSCAGGCPAPESSGKLNGAFSFDNSQGHALAVAPSAALDSETITVAAWIKVTPSAPDEWRRVVAAPAAFSSPYAFTYPGEASPGVNHDAIIAQCVDDLQQTPADSLRPDTWHHVAMTCDGGVTAIFIDGAAQPLSVPGFGMGMGSELPDLLIGNRQNLNRGADGLIDEVAIWSRILDPTELQGIYDMQRGEYVAFGGYVSVELDAGGSATWSRFEWAATEPSDTYLVMTTRSSADGSSWTSWTAVSGNPGIPASPPNRFFQYRVQPRSETGERTPTVDWVEVTYIQ